MMPQGTLVAVVPTSRANDPKNPLDAARKAGLLRIVEVTMGGGSASLTWFKIYVPAPITGSLGFDLAMWASWSPAPPDAVAPAALEKGDPVVEIGDGLFVLGLLYFLSKK
jgi:hypothetical protein